MIIFFRNKKVVSVLLVICMICNIHTRIWAAQLSDGEILARSCAVMDGYNERILFGKNANSPMANASTTKIMTCILVLEKANLNDFIPVSKNAATQPKVRLGLEMGKEYLLKDLVYGLMLESFNDCAVAIAEHVAGSVEKFADMMNEKAKELGCEDTYFITPNGLDAEENGEMHHTTAVDLCKIMKYCVWESPCSDMFLKITQTLNYECKDANGKMHLFVNHNQLYQSDANAISGKTGYTAKAGYCYVTAYEKEGLRFCIALLGCGWPNHKDYKWIDSRKIIAGIRKEYNVSEIKLKALKSKSACLIKNGFYGEPTLEKWGIGVKVVGSYSLRDQSVYKYMYNSGDKMRATDLFRTDIEAPVARDEIIGETRFYLNNEEIACAKLVASEAINEWDLKNMLKALFLQFF